jgi:hypothetical protein
MQVTVLLLWTETKAEVQFQRICVSLNKWENLIEMKALIMSWYRCSVIPRVIESLIKLIKL